MKKSVHGIFSSEVGKKRIFPKNSRNIFNRSFT